MVEPKVSVCMVTYNHEPYIAQAVESALAQQTKFPFEIVIGEDCSRDGTQEILRRLARQNPALIRLRLAARNQGGKANFMGTLADCRGRYVAMLEGDDYWTSPQKLQMQIEALDAHPEWTVCFHPAECVYEAGMQGQSVYPFNWTKPVATIEDLFEANFMATNSVVFRNRLFPELPAWFCELKLGDWPLHILNAAHGNIGFLPEVMSAYRIHRGGMWTGETPAAKVAAIFQMFTAIDHHFAGKFAAAIDGYRLNFVRDLMTEVRDVKNGVVRIIGELSTTKMDEASQTAIENPDMHTLQNFWNLLSAEIALLENRNRTLQDFHDEWSTSAIYRIVRETRRMLRRLANYINRPKPVADEPQSTNASPIKNAA